MADHWHYTKGTDRHGPVSKQELRRLADAGELQPTDLVWSEGMSDWRPARDVEELFPATRQTPTKLPPPLPPPESKPDSTHKTNVAAPMDGFLASAAAKAKDLATKASTAAQDFNAKIAEQAKARSESAAGRLESGLDDSQASAPGEDDSPHESGPQKHAPKWAMWTVGGGLLALCSLCLVCGLCGGLLEFFGDATRSFSIGGSSGLYADELASKHEALYMVGRLYDFGSAQFAVGVDGNGQKATVYWRHTTVFREFNSRSVEALINAGEKHARNFKVDYELDSNELKGKFSWVPTIVGDNRYTRSSFRFELTDRNRYKADSSGPAHCTEARFKDSYTDLSSMAADFDALYMVETRDIPSPGLKEATVGVYGRKPEAVIFCRWDSDFERLTDRNCGGLPRDDVLESSVTYQLGFAKVKGRTDVKRRVEGFRPKSQERTFGFQLEDGDRYRQK